MGRDRMSNVVDVLVVPRDGGHLDDDESDRGRDVVLHGEDTTTVSPAVPGPSDTEQNVDEEQRSVELRMESAEPDVLRESGKRTATLGYSEAGRRPLKTFSKSTTPV